MAEHTDIPRGDELAERNRDILAERLNWPDGTAEQLRDLEKKYPEWSFAYLRGGLPMVPNALYTAQLRGHRWNARPLEAHTIPQLEELVRRADGDPPFVSAFG